MWEELAEQANYLNHLFPENTAVSRCSYREKKLPTITAAWMKAMMKCRKYQEIVKGIVPTGWTGWWYCRSWFQYRHIDPENFSAADSMQIVLEKNCRAGWKAAIILMWKKRHRNVANILKIFKSYQRQKYAGNIQNFADEKGVFLWKVKYLFWLPRYQTENFWWLWKADR